MTNASGRSRGASATASAPGPSIYWRLGMSSWLLLLLVGGGAMAWLAFGILAGVARRRSWGVFAAVYALAAIAVQLPEDPAAHIAQGTLYLVVLLHGLIINHGWLLLLWCRHENGLTLLGTARGGNGRGTAPTRPTQPATALPKAAERLLGGGGTSRSDYVDDSAAAPPAPRRRRSTRAQRRAENAAATPADAPARSEPARPAPVAAAELVDVNTANQRTLAKLTGMDRGLAKAAVAERTKRGGFASLEAFAATAGLQPHEMVRLAGEAFCSPRPRAARSFGRRVDF